MNYEDFYVMEQVLEKGMKDKLQNAQKSFKNISKNADNGDLKSLTKDLNQLQNVLNDLTTLSNDMNDVIEGFDIREYFSSGEFSKQMVDYCEEYDVDVKGESPSYEIFPYKVKIDYDNQDIQVDRKKVSCVRPLKFVTSIKEKRDKYIKASFNVNVFLSELAAAYDLAITLKNATSSVKRDDSDLFLKDLYEYMAPTQRARRDYDLQNYAFDLSRLYSSGIDATKDGRAFTFGSTRNSKKYIRILDSNGSEQLLGTICFHSKDNTISN